MKPLPDQIDQPNNSPAASAAAPRLSMQIGRYLTASGIGTAAHYALMASLIHLAGVDAVVASSIGAVVGAVIIYILNYYVTFQSKKNHQVAALRFTLVAAFSVLANGMILKGLLSWLDWHYILLQGITTLTVFSLTYLLNRTWTF